MSSLSGIYKVLVAAFHCKTTPIVRALVLILVHHTTYKARKEDRTNKVKSLTRELPGLQQVNTVSWVTKRGQHTFIYHPTSCRNRKHSFSLVRKLFFPKLTVQIL